MKKIFETHKAAVIAAAVIVVAVIGGIAAFSNGSQNESEPKPKQELVYPTSSLEDNISSQESEPDVDTVSEESAVSDSDDPMSHMGNEVAQKVDELMKALSEGDLETMYRLTNSDFIEKMKDSEEFKKILIAVYGDAVWNTDCITDGNVDYQYRMAKSLNRDELDVYVDVGTKRYMYYKQYDILRYEKGDRIPADFKYETKEEAWEAFEETLSSMPRIYQRWTLKMTFPDEEGNYYFSFNFSDFKYFINDSFVLTNTKDDDKLLINLLAEICQDGVIIAPDGAEIAYNEEVHGGEGLRAAVVELLKKKDFEGARQLILEYSDEDFFNGRNTYDTLTDVQKAYVDEVLENSDMYAIETARSETGEMHVNLLMETEVLQYRLSSEPENLMDWINDNELKSVYVIFATMDFFLDDFVDHTFGAYYDIVHDAQRIKE